MKPRSHSALAAALALLFLSVSSAQQVSPYASVSSNKGTLVKTGRVALPDEYQEVLAIEFKRKDGTLDLCTGVLIASNSVITAAHCARDGSSPVRVMSGSDLQQMQVLNDGGYARMPAGGVPVAQTIGVASVAMMDENAVSAGKKLYGRDMMVIRLKAEFVAPVRPISIANLGGLDSVQYVRIAGFGQDGLGDIGRKLYADMKVVEPRCRAGATGPLAECDSGSEMFARSDDGKFDSCPGDSGGPVYVRNKGGDFSLVGITSRATSTSAQCGGGSIVTLLDGRRLDWLIGQAPVSVLPQPLRPESTPPCSGPPCM